MLTLHGHCLGFAENQFDREQSKDLNASRGATNPNTVELNIKFSSASSALPVTILLRGTLTAS